jgi:hypothetical protein
MNKPTLGWIPSRLLVEKASQEERETTTYLHNSRYLQTGACCCVPQVITVRIHILHVFVSNSGRGNDGKGKKKKKKATTEDAKDTAIIQAGPVVTPPAAAPPT